MPAIRSPRAFQIFRLGVREAGRYTRLASTLCLLLLISACAPLEKTMVATDPSILGRYELKNVTVNLAPVQNARIDSEDYTRLTRHLADEIRKSLAREGGGTAPINIEIIIRNLNLASTAGIILGGSIDLVLAEVNVTDPANPARKLASFQTLKTAQYAMGGLLGAAIQASQEPGEIRLSRQVADEIRKKLNPG
jgi:hypothetical protein